MALDHLHDESVHAPTEKGRTFEEPTISVDPPRRFLKRPVECLISLTLAVATAPIQLVLLAISAISFRANPVFSQSRVGRDSESFLFRKIRSLPKTAPSEAPKGDLAEVANTRTGRFLRRTHLDELLQLWAVVGGTMSLVGPRPEMHGLTDTYPADFVEIRTAVRPGVTGLWQISSGSDGLIGETPQFDVFYVKHSNWRLDLWIAVRTVAKMLSGKVVDLQDVPGWARRAEK